MRLERGRRLAFRHQLALVVTVTSAVAVGLAALGSLGYEASRVPGDLRDSSLPLARIIGANSVGALAFNDEPAARETLAALALTSHVVAARLYTAPGRPFATYRRAGAEADAIPERPGTPGSRFEDAQLLIFEPVVHDGESLGTLYLKFDTEEGMARLRRKLAVLGLGFVCAIVVALALSARLQQRVAGPVLELASAARRVSEARDYSIRVEPAGPKELRELTVGFNEMLTQIQERDTALRAARDQLELRVAERVRELRREVSERRKVEAVSERRARLLQLQAAALESAADAVVIADRDWAIQWMNSSFCTLMGCAFDEVAGRSAGLFRSGRQEDEATYAEMMATAAAGRVWDGELIGRRSDGTMRLIAQTLTPVVTEDGGISHYVAVMRDVSQRRRIEEQLRQGQKMEAIGRLSGGVAHDFNNILNVIIGFTELLLKKLPQDDALRRNGREILKAASRGASLTRQLLAFSRQQVLQPKVIDLNAAITELEKMLARLIGEDVELVTSLEPRLGRVEVDPGQIEQVLMNLVVNARDAMPDGGTLTIESTNVDVQPEVHEYDNPVSPGPYVRIAVTDTGSGMDAATLSRIFEPFFSTKAQDKGTGLGLATVYGIVKQSRGYIWARSSVGEGTTFTILLPRVTPVERAAGHADETGTEPTGRETILVAEDDDAARELLGEMLEELGYRTIVASNGVDALERAAAHAGRIDLLLSDVVMPRLGGRELAARLRVERGGELPTIFMSGYTADTVLRKGISEGGNPFLQKPFTAQQLAQKLRETLDEAVRTARARRAALVDSDTP